MNRPISYSAGEVLINEGASDSRLFILESGILEIRKGDKVICEIDAPNRIVGEIGLVLEERRSCSVIAKTDCNLLLVGNSINEIIDTSPRLTKMIMQELAERLVKTTSNFANAIDALLQKGIDLNA